MRRLLMSRLIRIFTVCLVNLFFIPIIELCNKQSGCLNLAVCPNLPDFTLVVFYNLKTHTFFSVICGIGFFIPAMCIVYVCSVLTRGILTS